MSEDHDRLRRLLFGIAYRMVGRVAEAEDVVQEAFLRHRRALAAGTEIADERAYLTTVATRLAIDHLRSARVRREAYIGPWLPEPLLTDPAPGPDERAERAESLSLAFLAMLERLSPVERAVFLLRDVFDLGYDEVAAVVERGEPACRQIAARARAHLERGRPRFAVDRDRHEALTERFLAACTGGDSDGLMRLLADDAAAYTDGGGRTRAAPRPVLGARAVARFMALIAGRMPDGGRMVVADVNGQPGRLVLGRDGTVLTALVLVVDGERVRDVLVVANPDKLAHLSAPA